MTLAIILIFLAFICIGLHLSRKDTEVEFHDQVIREKGKVIRISKQKSYITGLVIGVIAGFILTGSFLITIIIGLLSCYFIGEKLHAQKETKRKNVLEDQYIQVLSSMLSSLQAGSNPYQALENVVHGLKNPARDIFLEILRKTRTNIKYTDAIRIVAEESGWEDLKQIQVALELYDSSGSDLVEVFNYLLQTAYETKSDRKYIEGVTSQIRTTAMVLSIMPFFLMGAMRFMAPEFVYPLFNEVGGIIVIIIIIISVVIGNKIVNKMIENIY